MAKDYCNIGGLIVNIHPHDSSLTKMSLQNRAKKYFGQTQDNKMYSQRNALYVENCVMLQRFLDDEEEIRNTAWQMTLDSMPHSGLSFTRPDLAHSEDINKQKVNKLKAKILKIMARFVGKEWIPMRDCMVAEGHLHLSYMQYFDDIIQANDIIHRIATNKFNQDMWVEVKKSNWVDYYLLKYNFSKNDIDI